MDLERKSAFPSDANFLVTGGGGFIGTNLIYELSQRGIHPSRIHIYDRQFSFPMFSRDRATLHQAELEFVTNLEPVLGSPSNLYVFHLAANSDIQKSSQDPSLELRDTFGTTFSLVSSILQAQVRPRALVFASLSAIFGSKVGKLREDSQVEPLSNYGKMKALSEKLLELSDGLADRVFSVRFPNVVGKWSTHGVIHDLVRKVQASSSWFQVLGDGSQEKPYLHSEDLVKLLLDVCFNDEFPHGYNTLNVGPEDTATVSDIVREILIQSGSNSLPKYQASRAGWPGDVPEYRFDTSYLKLMTGVKLPTSMSAIRRAVKDELERY